MIVAGLLVMALSLVLITLAGVFADWLLEAAFGVTVVGFILCMVGAFIAM